MGECNVHMAIIKCLTVIAFISLIPAFIIKIVLASELRKNYDYIINVGKNWNLSPMTDLRTISNNERCIFPDLNLISNKWKGTDAYCYKSNSYYKSQCTGRYPGTRYSETPPINYFKWKGTEFCTKRIEASYLDFTIAVNENSCPNNFKSCGIIDTLNNVMCIPSETPCPINYIKFISYNDPNPIGFDFKSFSINDGFLISSNVNKNGNLLIQFILSQTQPCLYPQYASDRFVFSTEKNKYDRVTCYLNPKVDPFDKNYVLQDEYDLKKVYDENGVTAVLNEFPQSKEFLKKMESEKGKMGIYSKQYIGISVECHNKIKNSPGLANRLLDQMLNFNNENGFASNEVLAIVGYVFDGTTMIAIICYFFMIFNTSEVNFKFQCCCTYYNILLLVTFIITTILFSNINGIELDVNFIMSNCGDEIFSFYFTDGYENFKSAQQNVVLGFIFTLLPVVIHFVQVILAFIWDGKS